MDTILDASNFGVPQRRQRFFVLATNNPKIALKVPVSKRNGVVPAKEAFVGLPLLEANSETEPDYYEKQDSEYTKLLKNRN